MGAQFPESFCNSSVLPFPSDFVAPTRAQEVAQALQEEGAEAPQVAQAQAPLQEGRRRRVSVPWLGQIREQKIVAMFVWGADYSSGR